MSTPEETADYMALLRSVDPQSHDEFAEHVKQLYIEHEDYENPDSGVALFGPFSEDEIMEVMNSEVADMLAASGPIETIYIRDSVAQNLHINSRDYWFNVMSVEWLAA